MFTIKLNEIHMRCIFLSGESEKIENIFLLKKNMWKNLLNNFMIFLMIEICFYLGKL